MIRTLSTGEEYDVCIIGGGPAGLVVAAELAYTGLRVSVLESGGDKRTAFADALKDVQSSGLPIKHNSRERMLGGSGVVWGGLSAPLDAQDFSSWPISGEELLPYLSAAARYGFPAPHEFEGDSFWQWSGLDEKRFIAIRPPYNFARLRSIFERRGMDLFLHATTTALRSTAGRIEEALCKSPDGREVSIRSKIFVLAAGGIENARLLLASSVGNEYDQVGRYFMNHPKGYAGRLRLRAPLPAESPYLPRYRSGRMIYAGLALSDDLRRRSGLLGSYVQFEPDSRILARYVFGLWRRLPSFASPLFNVLRPRVLRLRWYADMEPRPENRVVLSQERDALGSPKAEVTYSLGTRDEETVRQLHSLLVDDVKRLGLGKVEGSALEAVSAVRDDASHHLGATRMGEDPRGSVVNRDCRVHGTENLYIAGGSVFPAGGSANPTYTIVALAIRLAEHLTGLFPTGTASEKVLPSKKLGRVAIVGAGKRIQEDVVPALESLSQDVAIEGIYARHPGRVFGSRAAYDVRTVEQFSAQNIDALYVAVPTPALSSTLEALLPRVPLHVKIVVDTPVRLSRSARRMLERRPVHIAEDSIYLPWLELAQAPREVVCRQSVYRYHGIALLKALSKSGIRLGIRLGDRLLVWTGAMRACIEEPRDYSKGTLLIDGEEPRLRVNANRCEGFSYKGKTVSMSKEESELAGFMEEGDTIVTRMPELKRVGLRRLIHKVMRGEETWPLAQGAQDYRADRILHRFFVYFSLR